MLLSIVKNLIIAMRPKQWVKNGFLFAAIIFDRQLNHVPALLHTVAGFIIFCIWAGVVYIINDLIDLQADRNHPKKRLRPIAAGNLPIPVAKWTVVILLLIVFPLAYLLSPYFAVLGGVYCLLNLSYSIWFKHFPIIDVLVLASFYVLRVEVGVVLVRVSTFSPWLYLFTTFLALFLGIGKRRNELMLLATEANTHRRVFYGYNAAFLDQLLMIVSSVTIITYSLYTFTAPNLQENHAMMLTIPFVIYGVFRYLYLVQVDEEGGAPEEVLFTDRFILLTVLLWGMAVLWVFYGM